MGNSQPGGESRFDFFMPDDLEPGMYANALSVWFTPHEFTLDFGSLQTERIDDDGTTVVPFRIVARVKLPATLVFEAMRELNRALAEYERRVGEIRRPGGDAA